MSLYKKYLTKMGLVFITLPTILLAEKVGIFYNLSSSLHEFAAGDIEKALKGKNYEVEKLNLSTLSNTYPNKKIVLAVQGNSSVTNLYNSQGGSSLPSSLVSQAYALRTTSQTQQSYWIFGGDSVGAMYGGFQISENISLEGYGQNYSSQEAPYMEHRGMKVNMPLDRRIPTYVGGWSSNSTKRAIPHAWDINFWKTLIDQQARSRYNLLSVWVHHPFPALVKLTGTQFENISLPNIEGKDDGYVRNDLTHEKRVEFWKDVMKYAHSRGMKFYFFHWNVVLDHAKDVNKGLTDSPSNSLTKTYMYESMKKLLETYPDLDGWGLSAGDNMTHFSDDEARADWNWAGVGKAIYDHLKDNPNRKFNFIHRGIYASPELVEQKFGSIRTLPNATVNYSVKYAQAHMYSTPTPTWTGMSYYGGNNGKNIRTFMTIRNDGIFYLNWGDPKFARDYMNGVPNKAGVDGFYIGADGYTPAKSYFYKDNSKNTMLEVERRWYMEMLWGRLGYNPSTEDKVLVDLLKNRYPNINNHQNLFTAWSLASRGIPKGSEMLIGGGSGQGWGALDYQWWPEANLSEESSSSSRGGTGFRSIDDYGKTLVAKGSDGRLCDIATTAKNNCGSKKTSYAHANEIVSEAATALNLSWGLQGAQTFEEQVAVENIRQLAYIGSYLGYKIKGATFKLAGNGDSAKAAMALAYCHWMDYRTSMEKMYKPDTMRNMKINGWGFGDTKVLDEYRNTGKATTDTPNCKLLVSTKPVLNSISSGLSIQSFDAKGVNFSLSTDAEASITLFDTKGKVLFQEKSYSGKKGSNQFSFPQKLGMGLHFVQIKVGSLTATERSKFTVLR